jgi:hypothetical protein
MSTTKSLPVLAVTVMMAAACKPTPVEWHGAAQPLGMPAPSHTQSARDPVGESPAAAVPGDENAAPASARLVLRADGSPALEAIPAVATSPAASDSSGCIASLRTGAMSPTEIYGVWWTRRADGRAWLVAARSDDGGATWTRPVPVDTTDRGTVACERPAPAIAADSQSGYVHVTYFLYGPDGPGVFFSHSMERGELFHSPVPIMYGHRPAATAVAADDSVVVVAFEDPNSERARVALAFSRTWGHIFARERPAASSGEAPAQQPVAGVLVSLIAVGWLEGGPHVVARVGTLK